jgi:hypothetical protein
MVKKPGLHKILGFVAWITGIIVSLSVAFAMTEGTIGLPFAGKGVYISVVAGWVVILTTLLSILLSVIDYFN